MIGGAYVNRHPGGFWWLFAHEIRLALRSIKGGIGRKLLPALVLLALPTLGGVALAWALGHAPAFGRSPAAINIVSLLLCGVGLLMLPSAVANVIRTFHDRADFDLLLSSPVPASRLLAAKAVGLYVSVAAPFLIFFGPFLIASAFFGHAGLLGGLAMILVLGVVATALAFAAARALYRAIGPRGARVILQVGAGLLGAIVFLGFQAQNLAPQATQRLGYALLQSAAPPAPLDWPARAALGDIGPLALLLGLAAEGAWGATRLAARVILEPPTERTTMRRLPEGTPRFASGLTRIMVSKELRLLARDPELLAQVTLRLVFLVPAIALVFRGGGAHGENGFDAPRLAAAATVFAGFLASSLGWLTVCAEDAPELLAAAPVAAGAVRRAKWIAACAPPIALALIPAALAASLDVWAGLVALTMAGVSAASAAALQGWYGKPAPRKAFKVRQRGGLVLGLAELAMVGAWGGTALLIARLSPFALLPGLAAGAILYAAGEGREEAARKRSLAPVRATS